MFAIFVGLIIGLLIIVIMCFLNYRWWSEVGFVIGRTPEERTHLKNKNKKWWYLTIAAIVIGVVFGNQINTTIFPVLFPGASNQDLTQGSAGFLIGFIAGSKIILGKLDQKIRSRK